MQKEDVELEIGGTLQQRITSCIQVMDRFMKQDEVVVSSMVVAEKRSVSGTADNVVDAVAHIIGTGLLSQGVATRTFGLVCLGGWGENEYPEVNKIV